jgi:transposase-like protein
MVWKERSRMDERMLLIGEYLKGERGMTDLCQEFGISRKTAYKWSRDTGRAGQPGSRISPGRPLLIQPGSRQPSCMRWSRRGVPTRTGVLERS